jgi:2-keto-4-pentenoate hydratase/2-oxohepta-3-ene-1,7-dioic acid hydratase in catechol pathway
MRICRFGDDRLGVVADGLVHDVSALQAQIRAAAPYTMKGDAVVKALPEWRDRFAAEAAKVPGVPLSSVKLLAPVARPSKVMAAPSNYRSHIAEMETGKKSSKFTGNIADDGVFLKANSAIIGQSEGVPVRFPDRRTDHELELVVIIGKQGTDISLDHALDHVAGYCLGLDMVVRGPQDRSLRKSMDGYAVLGPWMVTADEVPDVDDVPLSLKVNGELKQQCNTKDLVFGFHKLIEYASSYYTLYPGDCFYSGTTSGVGPVKPGDVITVESPLIGTMDVPVRAHILGQS